MSDNRTIAASIWPRLAADRPAPSPSPQQRPSSLAASMWPSLVVAAPKPVPEHILEIRQALKDMNAALKAERLEGKR
jgi:hypothetical protein